jgi:hypothetical protein
MKEKEMLWLSSKHVFLRAKFSSKSCSYGLAALGSLSNISYWEDHSMGRNLWICWNSWAYGSTSQMVWGTLPILDSLPPGALSSLQLPILVNKEEKDAWPCLTPAGLPVRDTCLCLLALQPQHTCFFLAQSSSLLDHFFSLVWLWCLFAVFVHSGCHNKIPETK